MDQLLTTKLFIPKSRPDLVSRPRLIEQLNEGLHSKLTLVSAPAGFGKTTLVSEWIANCKRPTAWLSLDSGDSNSARFLAYFIAALQTVAEKLGEDILAAIGTAQPAPLESLTTALINEIAALPQEFILVLDDYHVLDANGIDDALIFLLEHLPPQMHLVITTREDPNLPLARLRARGELIELRAADLRFTYSEAAEFLNRVMNLGLSEEDIAALENRTEGWIAGLQLAALSMRGRDDIPAFVQAFAGDHSYIVDYLVEEVLQRQNKDVRDFLLQTSILSRLSGPLCEAVTGQKISNQLLEELGQRNMFLIPLDDKRSWFRYHTLFSDVLQAHLMAEQPDLVPILHHRASEWYERHGSRTDAICHALAAENIERAADLIELAWSEMNRSRQSEKWLHWAKLLPDEVVHARPVLNAGYAWALLDRGELEGSAARLQEIENQLEAQARTIGAEEHPSPRFVVVDQDEYRFLPSSIAAARAYHSLALGDMPGTVRYGRQALDFLPGDDHLRRGIPASLLGLAHWSAGDLEAADRALVDSMTSFQKAGNILFANTGAYVLADIRMTLGRLRQAFQTLQQSLQLAEGQSRFVLWGTADLHTGLSELYREQNDLKAAGEHLRKSKQFGEPSLLPRWRFRWCLAQARLKESCGDLESALEFLDEAEQSYLRGPVPDIRPVGALRARIWIKQNRLPAALTWARDQGLSPNDDLTFLNEFEHITLARILIAQYKQVHTDRFIQDATRLLERLLKAADKGGRIGSVIEILVLQALAHEAQGDLSSALTPLERAVRLAEPEGYIRIFAEQGIPMTRLLAEAMACGVMPEYTAQVLQATEMEGSRGKDKANPLLVQPLVEPLSERELEILQLIAQGLSNREICQRLFLAMPTIKGHNRNIFGKLQVKRRTEAVARARDLGLL